MERIFIVSFFFFALCLYISSKDAFGAPVEREVTLEDGTVLKMLINDPQTPPPPHFDSLKQDNKNDSSGKVGDNDSSSQNQDIIIHELKYPPPPKMESLTHGDGRSEDNSSNNNDDTQDIILHEAVRPPSPVRSEKQDGNSDDARNNNGNSSNNEEPSNVVIVEEKRPPSHRMEDHRLRRNTGTGGNADEPSNVFVVQEIHPPPPRMESRRRRRNAGTGGNTDEPPNAVVVVKEIRPPPPRMESRRRRRDDGTGGNIDEPSDVFVAQEIHPPPPRRESRRRRRENQPDVNVNLANNMSSNYEITTEGSVFTGSQGIAGENESALEEHGEIDRVSKDLDMNTSATNESTDSQGDLQSAANVFTTPDAGISTATQIYLNESSAVTKNESLEMQKIYTGPTNISEDRSILDRKDNDTNIRPVVDNSNPDVLTDGRNNTLDKPVDSAGNNSTSPDIDRKAADTDDADADGVVDKPGDSARNNSINPDIVGREGANTDDADADADDVVDKPDDYDGDNSINSDNGRNDANTDDADANNVVDNQDDSAEDGRINLDSVERKPFDGDKHVTDTGDKDDNALDLDNGDDDDDDGEYGTNGRFNDGTDVDSTDKELSTFDKEQTEEQEETESVYDDNAGGTDSGKPYSKGELLGSGRSELQRKLVAEESQSTHFMSYFLVAVVFVACFYLVFHNRQKIKAYVLEGRSGLRGGRRRKAAGGEYRQLSSTEDVLPASDKTLDPKTAYAY